MADSIPTEPQKNDLQELRSYLDETFRKYMHGHQILSTLPASTLRTVHRQFEERPRRRRDEQELLHQMVATMHVYESEAVASSESGADFASGLLASAACEALAIIGLVQQKAQLKRSLTYRQTWADSRARNKPTFCSFLLQLRSDDLFKIAREMQLYNECDLPEQVSEALKQRGYPKQLTQFVRRARNAIHPRWRLHANERYAKRFGVYYSLEDMQNFHIDFALCAWELYGRIGSGIKSEKLIKKAKVADSHADET